MCSCVDEVFERNQFHLADSMNKELIVQENEKNIAKLPASFQSDELPKLVTTWSQAKTKKGRLPIIKSRFIKYERRNVVYEVWQSCSVHCELECGVRLRQSGSHRWHLGRTAKLNRNTVAPSAQRSQGPTCTDTRVHGSVPSHGPLSDDTDVFRRCPIRKF